MVERIEPLLIPIVKLEQRSEASALVSSCIC